MSSSLRSQARDSTRRRVAVVRAWSLRMLDVVPGLRRLVNDLVRIEVIDRSMVIAAQGLLTLVPLLIVLLQLVGLLGSMLQDAGAGDALRVLVRVVAGTLRWTWTK